MGPGTAFAATFAALAIQSAAANQLAPLGPSGPWNVEYAENMCILSRSFGADEESVTLVFRPAMFSGQMRILLIKPAATGKIDSGQARLSTDGAEPIEAPYIEGFSKKDGIRVIALDLHDADLAPLKSAKQFRVEAGKLDFVIAPTSVPAAMSALEKCQKDLLVAWGMEPAVVESIATFPTIRGGIVSIFKTEDYPLSAIRNEEEGTTELRYWVSRHGDVSDCQIVQSSGSRELDKQSCQVILRRGRFDPARLKSGEPVPSIGFARIRWELP